MTERPFRPPKKHYRHQIGWIAPPRAFDAAINDFFRIAPSDIGVIQRILHAPDFSYTLENRRQIFHQIEEAVSCLAECGAHDIAQVGCNFAHCTGHDYSENTAYRRRIEKTYGVRLHMEAVCLIEAVSAMMSGSVALLAGYNDRSWLDGYLRFVADTPVKVVYAQNFVEQGFFVSEEAMAMEGFIFPSDILPAAIERALASVPDVAAIVFMGMPSWETPKGDVLRTMAFVDDMESRFDRPVVCGEMAIFWSVFSSLGVALERPRGRLLRSLGTCGEVSRVSHPER